VFKIKEADLLNTNAQNAMLKLLEEPPSYASFILLAVNPGSLLETVRSRCVEIYVTVGAEDGRRQYSELSQELSAAFAEGDGLSLVRACARAEKIDKEAFDKLVERTVCHSRRYGKGREGNR
jgi:DNA polymerase III delta prime subunit